MKISCPSCSAKYSIADEKVQDRLAKIRCRKCGTTIVIDGKQDPPSVHAADAGAKEESQSTSDSSADSPTEKTYTVDVDDDDQRTMTLEEIVAGYNAGLLTADTYVWKEGMGDWEPLADVAEINAALHAAVSSTDDDDADDPTQAFDSRDLAAARLAAESSAARAQAAPPNEPSIAQTPEPALRSGGGRGSAADLFGSIDTAGSEHDITTSAAGSAVAATGARNESSVLFSLSALTSAPSGKDAKSSITEDSGLIDLAALTAGSSPDAASAALPTLDFGAAPLGPAPLGLAAAPLGAAPSPGFSVDARPLPPGGSTNTKFYVAVGGLVALGLGLGAMAFFKPEPPPPPAPAATVVIAAPPAAAEPTPLADPEPAAESDEDKAPGDDDAEQEAKAQSNKETAEAPAVQKAVTRRRTTTTKPTPAPTPPTVKKKAAAPSTKKPKEAPPKKKANKCNCKPNDLMCAMKCSAK